MRNQGIDTIFLAGFAMHVCVESTMRHGHDLGYTVVLLEDASAAFNKAQERHVLDDVVHHYGHRVKVDEFIAHLKQCIEENRKGSFQG